jgi:hypothetical protein
VLPTRAVRTASDEEGCACSPSGSPRPQRPARNDSDGAERARFG